MKQTVWWTLRSTVSTDSLKWLLLKGFPQPVKETSNVDIRTETRATTLAPRLGREDIAKCKKIESGFEKGNVEVAEVGFWYSLKYTTSNSTASKS